MSSAVLAAVLAAVVALSPAAAQRPGAVPKGPAPAQVGNVLVQSVYLRRDAVQQASQKANLANPAKIKPGGLLGSIKKTVAGDDHLVAAAQQILLQQIAPLSGGNRTVIVVIGNETDSAKVIESLAGVSRPITMAFVRKDFEDAASDNTVLSKGLAGAVTDQATNMWVLMPRAGARSKPDKQLAAKMASPTLWNGMFAAEGDAINVAQVKSLVAGKDKPADSTPAPVAMAAMSAPTAAPGTAATPAESAPAGGGIAVGDVVFPKIAAIKVLAEPKNDAKVLGTVAKTDELVVTAPLKNGFLKVEGVTLSGWVTAVMVTKP